MRTIKLKRTMEWLGDDLVICVQNENGHIGAVVIGQPYQRDKETHVTLTTFNRIAHKDDEVARMYVKAAVIKYGCVVTCICGIHLDDITTIEMAKIMETVKVDISQIEESNTE